MNIRKYFWSLNENAIIETYKILKNIEHPKYVIRMFTILSQTENTKEVFKVLPKGQFIDSWPKIRRYWNKKKQAMDFKAWWETVYEQLSEKKRTVEDPGKTIREIGKMIREKRINKGWTQMDFAKRSGVDQPYVSRIEKGKQMELDTLIKICKMLDIKNIAI